MHRHGLHRALLRGSNDAISHCTRDSGRFATTFAASADGMERVALVSGQQSLQLLQDLQQISATIVRNTRLTRQQKMPLSQERRGAWDLNTFGNCWRGRTIGKPSSRVVPSNSRGESTSLKQ